MKKRAGIYIRTSSEKQAERVSPQAQEADCREYCRVNGYDVIYIYSDTERYRANGRMVEPSGTRHDRPQLKRMLDDIDAGRIDVVIAWREDRLYRGVNRAMLAISERVADKKVSIQLVKEHYDPTIATVKAWAAGLELQARRDRITMGIAGRLKAGKIACICSVPPYGYDYDKASGKLVVNEAEAAWVRQIWQWFGEGVSAYEIRRRLIAEGVPQKGKKKRRYAWQIKVVQYILDRDDYYTGFLTINWDGEAYEIAIPVLLDAETYQAVKARKAAYKRYPAGKNNHYKKDGTKTHPVYALAAGVIYCEACGVKMGIVRINNGSGRWYEYYRCNNYHDDCSLPGCAHTVRIEKTDAEIWRKVWNLISEPGQLEEALEKRIAQLQAQETDAGADCSELERQLEDLSLERQKVINWARKKIITEQDLEIQLSALDQEETSVKRDLADKRLLVGNRAEKLLELAALYRERVQVGTDAVNAQLTTKRLQEAQFLARQRIISGLVQRVKIAENGTPTVELVLNLYDDCGILNEDIPQKPNLW